MLQVSRTKSGKMRRSSLALLRAVGGLIEMGAALSASKNNGGG